jgi:hypothetical protein
MQTSYTNNRAFLKKVDSLPTKGPSWTCDIVTVTGDIVGGSGEPLKEELELWRRDPVECVKELLGNPAFRKVMRFAPERIFKDRERNVRLYNEAWTGDFWWEVQVSVLCTVVIA